MDRMLLGLTLAIFFLLGMRYIRIWWGLPEVKRSVTLLPKKREKKLPAYDRDKANTTLSETHDPE